MQLNLPVIVPSKISTSSLFVERAIMTFDISISIRQLKAIAKLNLCGFH